MIVTAMMVEAERLLTLAAYIRGQARLTDGHPHKPGPGSVRLNNEEALLCADALDSHLAGAEVPHHKRCYGTKFIGYENPAIAGGSRHCPGCVDCKPTPPPAATTREPPHCMTCSCCMAAPPQPAPLLQATNCACKWCPNDEYVVEMCNAHKYACQVFCTPQLGGNATPQPASQEKFDPEEIHELIQLILTLKEGLPNMDKFYDIGPIAPIYTRVVEVLRAISALSARETSRPVAWIKAHVSHTDCGMEYDEEFAIGRDPPPGDGWHPLYPQPQEKVREAAAGAL